MLSFRCVHRHTAESHPNCYDRYVRGEESIKFLQIERRRNKRSAKILLVDIELLPGEYYAFDPRVDYLSPDKQIKDWSISCWAAKWLFEPDVMGKRVEHMEAFERDDRMLLGDIWMLMDEAQIVVWHNGNRFDQKKLYSKFLENKIPPPSKFLSVDTYKVAKEMFGQSYNRLDELGAKLGIGRKTSMHFDDWKNCLTNDRFADDALQHMLDYCKRDVAPLLEDVYLAMLPYIPNHPNMNIFTDHDQDVCPKCESTELFWGDITYPTPQGLWQGFRCELCGATGRGTSKEYRLSHTSIRC